ARCAASARTGRPRAFAGPRRTRADGPPSPLPRLPSPPERQYLPACVASPGASDPRSARLRVAVRICAPWSVPTTPLVPAAVPSWPGHDDGRKARLRTAAVAKAAQTATTAPTGFTVVPLLGLANVMSPPYTPTKVTASHMAVIATAPQISDSRHALLRRRAVT